MQYLVKIGKEVRT